MAEIQVGSNVWTVGIADYLHAFFSTVAAQLEPRGWGTRFPAVQLRLAEGELPSEDARTALQELREVREELRGHPPEDVVWDYEDRTQRPPWGDNIDPSVTTLADYFITYDGLNLLDVLDRAIDYGAESDQSTFINASPDPDAISPARQVPRS